MPLGIEEIARLAGVSRSTVSRVVNNHPDVREVTRHKVMQVIEQYNYSPNTVARALVTQKTNVLSVVIPQPAKDVFGEPYNAIVVQTIIQEANRSDYAVMLWMGSPDPDEQARFTDRLLRSSQFDGLIMISLVEDDPIVARLQHSEVPFIVLGPPPAENLNYINSDNVGGAYLAVEHLIQLGRQRIGMITGPVTLRAARDRIQGYYQAMADYERTVDPAQVIEGGYGEQFGYERMRELLARGVDAAFVSSDIMAIGALRAVKDAGLRVPDDVAIVGFDDIPAAATSNPALTTIDQGIPEFGVLATQALIGILEGTVQEPFHQIVPTRLVVRSTCGGIPPEGR